MQVLPKAHFRAKSFYGRTTSPPVHHDLPPRHFFPTGGPANCPYAKCKYDQQYATKPKPATFLPLHSRSRVKRSHQFSKMYSEPIVHQGAKVTTSLAGFHTGSLLLSFSGTSSSNCSPHGALRWLNAEPNYVSSCGSLPRLLPSTHRHPHVQFIGQFHPVCAYVSTQFACCFLSWLAVDE